MFSLDLWVDPQEKTSAKCGLDYTSSTQHSNLIAMKCWEFTIWQLMIENVYCLEF